MKKIIAMLLFILTCLILLFAVIAGVLGIWSMISVKNELDNASGTSGVDYLPLVLFVPLLCIFEFVLGTLGLVFSCISKKLMKTK